MNLTLEVISPGGNPGNPTRKVFGEEGGTIGRAATNSWVLLRAEVSGKHAVVSCRNGVFYVQDTSRNGISLNSLQNKLVSQRPYPLKSGDRLFIEPFEISVMVDDGLGQAAWPAASDPFAHDDPFAPASLLGPDAASGGSPLGFDEGEVDPLKFFHPVRGRSEPRAPEPTVRPPADALVEASFQPPMPMPSAAPAARPSGSGAIPVGYDPLSDFDAADVADPFAPPPPVARPPAVIREVAPPAPAAAPVPRPAPAGRRVVSSRRTGAVPVPPEVAAAPPSAPAPVESPVESRPVSRAPEPPRSAPPAATAGPDPFALLLEGAGLKDAPVTPELTKNFGEILRIVVAGVMDVLHARQGIKEEFRMRQTMFRPADNNPLKFSANVDDALHNLLVKRNPAYLGSVEAFADAFDDLRDHQIAMLAGMRVAFEHLLAQFDPERLQREFEETASKGLMPARLRYWDLFVEKRKDMARDPEAAFAELFGAEFARAYEEQFRQLRAQRGRKAGE